MRMECTGLKNHRRSRAGGSMDIDVKNITYNTKILSISYLTQFLIGKNLCPILDNLGAFAHHRIQLSPKLLPMVDLHDAS